MERAYNRTVSDKRLRKYPPQNSFIDPDIMRCVASMIGSYINDSAAESYVPCNEFSIFNVGGCDIVPSSDKKFTVEYVSIDTVEGFITRLFKAVNMEYELVVVVLIYLERMMKITNNKFRVCSNNWKATILACSLLSCKMFDDFALLNCDFTAAVGNGMLEVERVNALELKLVKIFGFECAVNMREYYEIHRMVQCMADDAVPMRESSMAASSQHSSSSDYLRGVSRVHPGEESTDGLVAVTKARYLPVKWTLHKGAALKDSVKSFLGSAVIALTLPAQSPVQAKRQGVSSNTEVISVVESVSPDIFT